MGNVQTTINPYLTFLGNCEEAFNFYKSVFGGEFTVVGRFSEKPDDVNQARSEDDKNKIMHISLSTSKETLLMGCDTGGEWGAKTAVGNNVSISMGLAEKMKQIAFSPVYRMGEKLQCL